MPTFRFTRVAPFIAIPLLILTAAMLVRFAIMGDKGWLMLAAGRLVSGERLSVDIFEVNPPLIVWLYAVPVWISRHIPLLPDYTVMGIIGMIVTACVILLCRRLIARHPAFAEDAGKRAEFALLMCGVLLFVVSPVYFFDREDIMLTLTFPYILRFMPSLAREAYPLPLRLVVGGLAAVGFCIKPHSGLVFVALQLFYLARDRSPWILASLENAVVYLFAAIYLAMIAYFTPDYFTTVLPMALAVYSTYNVRGAFHYYLTMAFFSLAIPLLDFRPRYATPYRRDILNLIVVALIYFGYALTNNGWGYTFQPFFSMATFLTGWLLWEYDWLKRQHVARNLPSKQFDVGMKGCIYCLAVNVLFGLVTLRVFLLAENCGGYTGCEGNKDFVHAISEKGITSFGVMSGEFTRWPQISWQSGAQWKTRFNHLWMVPGLIKAGEQGNYLSDQWIATYVGRAFADDINHRKPDAMFVDNSDEFFTYPHHNVDVIALLSGVPEFRKAWEHYRFDSTIDHCRSKVPDSHETSGCRYDIYRWKD